MSHSIDRTFSKNIIWPPYLEKMPNNDLDMLGLKDKRILIRLCQSVLLVVEIVREGSNVIVDGRLSHLNGEQVRIPEKYQVLVDQELGKIKKIEQIKHLQSKRVNTKYRLKLLLEEIHNLSDCEFLTIYQRCLSRSILFLQRTGFIKKAFKKSTLYSKRKNVIEILGNQISGNSTEDSKSEPEKMHIFESCASISEISPSLIPSINGGYTQIQTKSFKIDYGSNRQQQKTLCMKIPLPEQNGIIRHKDINRIQREIEIIRNIKSTNEHFVKYYLPLEQQYQKGPEQNQHLCPVIYMQQIKHNLSEQLSKNPSITDILNLSQQIIKAVSILHTCGIIHRDIKPNNFLIDSKKRNGGKCQKSVKLIDFGESVFNNEKLTEDVAYLGYTFPYSPLECMNVAEDSFNKQEIDYWSVGLILYEMIYGKNSLCTPPALSSDIFYGWKRQGQFNFFPNFQKKHGIRVIQEIISLIGFKSVSILQKDRLSLHQIQQIYDEISNFIQKHTQNFQKNQFPQH